MILNCPSCSAKFKVDQALLGDTGRSVRCGNCGHSWHQMPCGPESAPSGQARRTPAVAPSSEGRRARANSLDKLDQQRARSQRKAAVRSKKPPASHLVGWALLALFVAALAGGLVVARETIVALAPGTADYYGKLGLRSVAGAELELRDVASVRRTVDGARRLIVKGVIVNTSQLTVPVPRLQASLIDASGAKLASWVFAADSSELPAGGITTFETTANDPPREGNLSLVFVE
jgi:predicted Zn finger-like uncharacterized protein